MSRSVRTISFALFRQSVLFDVTIFASGTAQPYLPAHNSYRKAKKYISFSKLNRVFVCTGTDVRMAYTHNLYRAQIVFVKKKKAVGIIYLKLSINNCPNLFIAKCIYKISYRSQIAKRQCWKRQRTRHSPLSRNVWLPICLLAKHLVTYLRYF